MKENFKIKNYNKKNWKSGIIHAATPIWKTWYEIPEILRNPYKPQSDFHVTFCGADQKGGTTFKYAGHMNTFCLTTHDVTCKRCIEISEL